VNARENAHELYEQLAVGHALSALEPEDEHAFLAHLSGCAACEAAVAEHTETLSHLAYGAAAAEPPASLLEGIRKGVQESGRAGAFPVPTAPSSLDAARERRRHRTMRTTTGLIGAAAALVMVMALVFVNRGLQAKNNDLQAADARLSSVVTSLVHEGSRKVTLTGGGKTSAVAVLNGSAVSLVMRGVAANDTSNSIYVLWERSRFGVVRPVGTFDVHSSDIAVVDHLRLTGDADTVQSLIVTREQGRTAPPIAKGDTVVAGDA